MTLNTMSLQETEVTLNSSSRQLLSSNNARVKLTSSKPQIPTKRSIEHNSKHKTQQDTKIPLNRQVKPIGKSGLTADIRTADSMQFVIDNANQDNKKGKNFFAMDEENMISMALQENEPFKFMAKITRDEELFMEFISNMSYRGTYQLLESMRMIVRDYEANIYSMVKMKRMLTGVSKIAGASDTLVL